MTLYFNENPKPNNGNKHRNYGVLVTDTLKTGTYYEEINCIQCNELFLNELNDADKTCCKQCKQVLTPLQPKIKRPPKNIKYLQQKQERKRVKKEQIQIRKQRIKRNAELKLKNRTYSLYKHYLNKNLKFNIRPYPEDNDIVEFQCKQCDNWFRPDTKYAHIAREHNYHKVFCSTTCKSTYDLNHRKPKKVLKKHQIEWLILKHKEELKTAKEKRLRYLTRIKNKKLKELEQTKKPTIRKSPIDPEELKHYYSNLTKRRNAHLQQNEPKKFKLNRLFYYSKVRAKEKKIEHTITYEWLQQQAQNDTCSATGIKFDYDTTKVRNPFGPSVDRINISKGYTPENCRLVIWAFNAGLGHYTEQDLYTVCKAYLEFNNIK